jgi:hypothetical protein
MDCARCQGPLKVHELSICETCQAGVPRSWPCQGCDLYITNANVLNSTQSKWRRCLSCQTVICWVCDVCSSCRGYRRSTSQDLNEVLLDFAKARLALGSTNSTPATWKCQARLLELAPFVPSDVIQELFPLESSDSDPFS